MFKKFGLTVAMIGFLATGFSFLSAKATYDPCFTCYMHHNACLGLLGLPQSVCDAELSTCLRGCSPRPD